MFGQNGETRQQMRAALKRLTTRQRDVLVLHAFEKKSFSEIAAHLQTTREAVEHHLTCALASLVEEVGQQ